MEVIQIWHFDFQIIIDYSLAVFRWLQENFPGYVLWAQDTGAALAQVLICSE